MTLGELKLSLRKLGSDFDDTHVMIHTISDKGDTIYDLLAFVGHTPDFSAVVFGGLNAAKKMCTDGKLSDVFEERMKKYMEEEKKKDKKDDETNER
jgi:xylose isomerase